MSAEENKKKRGYDPSKNTEYQHLQQSMEALRQQKPKYENGYSQQVQDAFDQLQGRAPFSYDVNEDALYQQYRDQYTRLGRDAMEDTLGIAQAMTGGYANSYAQTAGQQAYQGYLSQLGDKLPQLYQLALDRYSQEGENLQQRYELARQQETLAYQRHQDALDSYRRDLAQLQTQADQAYDRGYQAYLEEYKRQQDTYEQVLQLMQTRGYVPTMQTLLDLGLTQEQAKMLLGQR